MIATKPTTIHLGADTTAEVHAATPGFPLCLWLSDGQDHCCVDLTVVTWGKLREAVEAALRVEEGP